MPYGKKSPVEMGHSPLEGHCTGSAAKMESNKQEKYNLMHDNPVAKHASGGSWMSKHAVKSRFSSSPLNQERPDPNSLKNEKGQSQKQVMDNKIAGMKSAESRLKDFQNKFKDIQFNTQDQVNRYNKKDSTNVANYNKSREAAMKSYDSITGVNDAYNLKVDAYNKKLDNMLDTPLNQGLILKNDTRPREVINEEMKKAIKKGVEEGRLQPDDGATGMQRIARDFNRTTPKLNAKAIAKAKALAEAIPSEKLTPSQKKKLSSTKYKKKSKKDENAELR